MEYVADVHHFPDRACRDSARKASGCEMSFVQTERRRRSADYPIYAPVATKFSITAKCSDVPRRDSCAALGAG
jgi:hypothetical protein